MPSPDPQLLACVKGRVSDFLGIFGRRLQHCSFIAGGHPTIADLSMTGYLVFPKEKSGYDLTLIHPAISAWLQRIAALPGWKAPYDMLPGRRLRCYA